MYFNPAGLFLPCQGKPKNLSDAPAFGGRSTAVKWRTLLFVTQRLASLDCAAQLHNLKDKRVCKFNSLTLKFIHPSGTAFS